MRTVKDKNIIHVDNIMTLEIKARSITVSNAVMENWTFEIEDEGARTGSSFEDIKGFMIAMTYVLNDVEPKDPFAVPIMSRRNKIMCHIYSHNLSEVFHWLRNIFNENMTVFTNTWMAPITADITINNVIFRLHDTTRLVPKTIEEWAKDENLIGNIVMEGMKIYREKYKNLFNIPVSQAGEVRRECRNKITDKAWIEQTEKTIRSYDVKTYCDLVDCFMGGTFGVNPHYRDLLLKNVYSYDMGSAYPGVMSSCRFPVSEWEDAEYDESDTEHAYYLKVNFTKVKSKTVNCFYPFKNCDDGEGQEESGHNLKSATNVTLTMTDVDFKIFKSVYDYEDITILKCRRSKLAYLPKQFIRLMLKYYNDKTMLKGTDQVSKYRESKSKINCFYGVAVTKTITDEILFENGEWKKIRILAEKDIVFEKDGPVKKEELTGKDFNRKRDEILKTKQFLSYQIGVWVTAYVRELMWNVIRQEDANVIYYDTDCVKTLKKCDSTIEKVNNIIQERIEAAAAFHKINIKKFSPKDKTIGCFENEKLSYEFKAVDIKRYAKRTDDGIEAFVSGMPKDHINLESVKDFRKNMKWTAEESGRYNINYNEGKQYTVSKIPASFAMNDYDDYDMLTFILGGNISNNKTKMLRSL